MNMITCHLSRGSCRVFHLMMLSVLLLSGAAQAQVKITGGITNKYRLNGTNYISHTFTNTQAITVLSDADVTYLSVAGGGGGALHNTDPVGGGGAGGFLTGTVTLVSSASYTVNVGTGGFGKSTGGEGSGSDGGSSYVTNSSGGTEKDLFAMGSGGGAGGMLTGVVTLVSGSYTIPVTVGGGGLGGQTSGANGQNGTNTAFGAYSDILAYGGGCGVTYGAGGNGGSGGGAAEITSSGGTGVSGQGNSGGNCTGNGQGTSGGGAGGAGNPANTSGDRIAAGGLGKASTIRDGVTVITYATGGKGRSNGATATNGENGGDNTGEGGGGGMGSGKKGGNGGSGVVIVRFAHNPPPRGTAITIR